MNQSCIIGAIEIGTSKITILVGEISNNNINILSHYIDSSTGVKKGRFIDLESVSNLIKRSITIAEKRANAKIKMVYLAITGKHLRGFFNTGSANVSSVNKMVNKNDIKKAKEDAKRPQIPENRSVVFHIQNPFSIDGVKTKNPLHMEGNKLKVGYWTVHGEDKLIRSMMQVMPYEVDHFVLSSLASSNILLQETEKEAGALVIDIGAGTTDYALYKEGYVVHTGVLAIGGDNISNDLSMGLRTTIKIAEDIKIKEGLAFRVKNNIKEKIWLIGNQSIGDREVPLVSVKKIVESRIKEIFEIIKGELIEANVYNPNDINAGVLLTGGTSKIEGILEIANKVFGIKCQEGKVIYDMKEEINTPEFVTVLGVLWTALEDNKKLDQSNIIINPLDFIKEYFGVKLN